MKEGKVNGNGFPWRMSAWTLLPPIGYFALTLIIFRQNSRGAERFWDLISTPGGLITNMLGLSGGFEAGLIAVFLASVFAYGVSGFALGYVIERLSGRKPWTRRQRCSKCDAPLKSTSSSGRCPHCETTTENIGNA